MGVCVFLIILLPFVAKGQILLDLPDPIMVLVGPTGSGKSSLANALLGCDPKSSDCLFQVCHEMDSCTKETTYGTGRWLGVGHNFTVVDSPGFGDSDGEDSVLIEEMVTVLKDTIKHASTILLVLKGTETRFNDALQVMLTQMSMIFGDQWWKYLVVGVSFWKLDQESIDKREGNCEHYPESCKNEEWFMSEINGQLEEKFHVKRNLTYAFIDSYSQAWPDIDDLVQQDHFQEQADVLWKETISRNSTIFFKGIDDVLRENAEMKEKIKWLEDVITTNITELMSRMEANEENDRNQNKTIDQNEDNATNERGILSQKIKQNEDNATNERGILSQKIDHNEDNDRNQNKTIDQNEDIASNERGILDQKIDHNEDNASNEREKLSQQIDHNEDNASKERGILSQTIDHNEVNASNERGKLSQTIDHNEENARHLEEDLIPGIGSIIPWIPSPDGLDAALQSKIPTGWQKCDGSQILSGPLINLRTPDLNGQGLFLRGGADSLVTTVQEDMVLDHAHIDPGHTHTDGGHKHTQDSHNHMPSEHYGFPSYGPYPNGGHYDVYIPAHDCPMRDICDNHIYPSHWDRGTNERTPSIHSASASIHSSKSGVSTVADDYNKGHENRPKNMVVTYIMRIF